jgi:DNA-directed RNA polymerase specialized sigma24 family protein
MSEQRNYYTDDDPLIVELYETGYSLREISQIVHWSKGFVKRRLVRNGVEIRGRGGNRKRPDLSQQAKAVALYVEQGYSLDDTARILGLSHNGVRSHLRRAGVTMRPRGAAGRLLVERRLSA